MSEVSQRSLERMTFQANEAIALQGDLPRHLGILRAGRVEVLVAPWREDPIELEEAKEEGVLVETLEEEGLLVGDVEALLGVNHATLVAAEATTLELIPLSQHSIDKSILKLPSLGLTMARSMAPRLCRKNDQLKQRGGALTAMRMKVDDYSMKFYVICERLMRKYGLMRPVAEACRRALQSETFQRGQRLRRQQQKDFSSLAPITSARRGRLVSIQAGSNLCEDGDEAKELYILMRGLLEVVVEGRVIQTIQPGEVIGEMALLLGEGARRTATVRAHTFCQVAAIPAEKFDSLLEGHPVLMLHIAKVLARRIANADLVIGEYQRLVSEALRRLCSEEGGCAEDSRRLLQSLKGVRQRLIRECDEISEMYDSILGDYERYSEEVAEAEAEIGVAEAGGLPERTEEAEYDVAVRKLEEIFEPVSVSGARADESLRDGIMDLAHKLVLGRNVGASYVLGSEHRRSLSAHSLNTCVLAVEMARRLKLGGSELEDLAAGALLHDVGMLATTESVSDEEHAELHTSTYAEEKLALFPDVPDVVRDIVTQHHECWDGSGYPEGLKGEEISIGGRIVAVGNDLDILTMKGSGVGEAMDVLNAQAVRYWPEGLAAMIGIVGETLRREEKARSG